MKKNKFSWYHLLIVFLSLSGYAQKEENIRVGFVYDQAGNQVVRFIKRPKPGGKKTLESQAKEVEAAPLFSFDDPVSIENQFEVSPNPTSGNATLSWQPEIATYIDRIELVSMVSSERKDIAFTEAHQVHINISGKTTGLYLVIFHLANAQVPTVQKKLVKL